MRLRKSSVTSFSRSTEAESQQRPLKERDRHIVLRQPTTDRIRRQPVVERAFETNSTKRCRSSW
jgi:hypothetical protein